MLSSFPKNGVEKVSAVDTAAGEQVGKPLAVQGESFWPMAMAPNGKRGYLSCNLGSTTNGGDKPFALGITAALSAHGIFIRHPQQDCRSSHFARHDFGQNR